MAYLLIAVVAAALALALTPAVRALAVRAGAIDAPGGRWTHDRPVPTLGGLAVLGAGGGALAVAHFLGDTTPFPSAAGRTPAWLAAGVVTVVATGVVDDLRRLRPLPKLALQALAALLAVVGGFGIAGFTNPATGAYVPLGAAGGVVTVVWIVAITNAFNLIDGLDGLAAGVGAIAAATLLAIAVAEGRTEAALHWAALGGALAGFLVYNFAPASIFLGDTGSLLLGYTIAVLAIESLAKGAALVVVVAPILALGLPIVDTALAVVRRTLAGGLRDIARADREHIHDRLVREGGLSPRAAVLALYAACSAFGAVALAAVATQDVRYAVLVAGAAAAIWWLTAGRR